MVYSVTTLFGNSVNYVEQRYNIVNDIVLSLFSLDSGNHWMRRLVNNYVKNGVEAAGRIFETHLRSITPVLRNLAQKTTVIFKMQDDLQVGSF